MSPNLKNFAIATVLTPPSPAVSGTTVVLASGQGARMPTVPFQATIFPAPSPTDPYPTPANAEVCTVTARSTDTLTITRSQEGSAARTIVAGDLLAATVTAQVLADLGGGGGGGGEALVFDVAQTAHGLSVGDVVRHDGFDYVLAQADSVDNAEVVGIVQTVADADNFTLLTGGLIDTLTGLTAGTLYFLDSDTAGALTATEPTADGVVSKPLLTALSTTVGVLVNMRGAVVSSAVSTRHATITLTNQQSGANQGNVVPGITAMTDWEAWAWTFKKNVDGKLYGRVKVPPDYASGGVIKFSIYANDSSGNVSRWIVSTKAVADGESLNPAALTSETAVDVTMPGTANVRKVVSVTLTETLAAGDELLVELFHNGDSAGGGANDTLDADTLLSPIAHLEYTSA